MYLRGKTILRKFEFLFFFLSSSPFFFLTWASKCVYGLLLVFKVTWIIRMILVTDMPPELLGINYHVNLKVIFFFLFLPPDIRRQNVDSVYKHHYFVSKLYQKKATKQSKLFCCVDMTQSAMLLCFPLKRLKSKVRISLVVPICTE